MDNKARLDYAFGFMAEAGLRAEQNFSCCGSCAHYEMAHELTSDLKGYAFYHAQDEENRREGNDFYIGYGGHESGLTDKEVGDIIVDCLTRAGLSSEWDGDPGTRILVNYSGYQLLKENAH